MSQAEGDETLARRLQAEENGTPTATATATPIVVTGRPLNDEGTDGDAAMARRLQEEERNRQRCATPPYRRYYTDPIIDPPIYYEEDPILPPPDIGAEREDFLIGANENINIITELVLSKSAELRRPISNFTIYPQYTHSRFAYSILTRY